MQIEFTAATSRYQRFNAADGVPVRTTMGHPRFKLGYEPVNVPELAPAGVFRNPAFSTVPQMIVGYTERLDRLQADIISTCNRIAQANGGQRLVFLCFDDVQPPVRDYCHRTWLSAWFRERHGLIVPELTQPPAPSPEQGSFF